MITNETEQTTSSSKSQPMIQQCPDSKALLINEILLEKDKIQREVWGAVSNDRLPTEEEFDNINYLISNAIESTFDEFSSNQIHNLKDVNESMRNFWKSQVQCRLTRRLKQHMTSTTREEHDSTGLYGMHEYNG